MAAYGFDESLSKVETPRMADYDTLSGRVDNVAEDVTTLQQYRWGDSEGISVIDESAVSYGMTSGYVVKRCNLGALEWTFRTLKAIPAYTTLASIHTSNMRPMVRHYFVDSTGKKFMITVTGYLQNVDALESGKDHVIGTTYMTKD